MYEVAGDFLFYKKVQKYSRKQHRTKCTCKMCLCTYFKMYSRAVHTNNLTAYCIMYILFVLHLTNSPLHLPHNVLQLKSSPLHLPYNVLHLTSGPLYFLLGLGNLTDSLFNNPKLDNGLGYNITKLSRRNLRIILIIIKRNPDKKNSQFLRGGIWIFFIEQSVTLDIPN